MKLIFALTLTFACVLANAQTKPIIIVQNTNAAACAWIEATFQNLIPVCTQNVWAILYPLPPNTDTVKFTMNYLDAKGDAQKNVQRVSPDGDIANYVVYGENLTVVSISAVAETPTETAEYSPKQQ